MGNKIVRSAGKALSRLREPDKRLSFFVSYELIFWSCMSITNFNVVFLYSQGLTNVQVGIALALNSLMSFAFAPVWGVVADKIGSKRKTLIILFAGTAVVSVLTVVLTGSVLATTVLFGLIMAFRGSLASVSDSWAIYNVNTPDIHGRRFSYGSVRIFGSIGFALSGFLFYFMINSWGVNVKYAFLGSAVLAVATLLFLFLHKEEYSPVQSAHAVKIKLSELAPGRLFKNFYFITFVFVYMLINMPAYFSGSYVANLLKTVGGVPVFVGIIGSVRALCEVPMLLYSKKLLKKIGYPATIIIIGTLLLIEQLSYIFCNRVWQVLAFQMLHGSINGLLLGSAVGYVFSLVPPELSATAQSVAASTCYIVSIIGNFLSGWVLDSYGIRMLYKVSAFCMGLAVVLFASSLLIGKFAKIKRYDSSADEISKTILARLNGEVAK